MVPLVTRMLRANDEGNQKVRQALSSASLLPALRSPFSVSPPFPQGRRVLTIPEQLYDQCRKSLRLQLLLINEPDSVYAETGPAPREPDVAPGTLSATVAAKKARVMALLEQVVDAILE
ncbi:hypothetical protein UVI_02047570 [Ustilaginoidea virens]|uniref:Uncharacterized protein n=1 Tax=Ustilaginoidea virens TaxID=1159556 RepID=A0A1B5L2B5_USTVR|nr:hypothetical protein UVI_02047570 [Ustilaginoidea virens]